MLLLTGALILDFVFYTGFYASDDIFYIDGARGLVEAGDGPATLGAVRLGVTVPSGLVYALSGGDVAAIGWFHVLYHLALVVLAFVIGRLLHDELTGLFAAGLAAVSPIFYLYAGAILPDNPTALWLALLLLLLELARRRAASPEQPMSARAAFAWHFAMGLLLGFAYSCKETGLIMTVPAAACVIAAAPRLRDPVWLRNGIFMAAGLVAFLGIEALALRGATGEWLLRLTMVGDAGDHLLVRMSQQGTTPLERFEFALERRLLPFAPLSTWLLLAGSVGYLLLRRRRLSPILFFWWPLLYMTIGSTSFTAYRPSSIQTRYYAIIILPAAVMTAAAIVWLLERWRGWSRTPAWARGRAAVAAVVIALGAVAVREVEVNVPMAGNIYRGAQVRAFTEAYEIARTEYPQYPTVLSTYLGRRMRPLLDEPNEDVHGLAGRGNVATGKPLPPPPYLLLSTADDLDDRIPPEQRQADEAAGRIRIIRPAATRLDLIEDGLRRLFGKEPRDPVERAALPTILMRVVEPPPPAHPRPAIRAPLIAWKDESAEVHPLTDGHVVSWREAPPFYLQLFDRSSYKAPPTHPTSKLAGNATRLRVSLEVRLVRGERAALTVIAYGYDAGGSFVQAATRAQLTAGGAPSAVAIDLASARPIVSFRIRTKVTPRSKRPGALVIGHPRVEALAGDAQPSPPPP